MMSKSILEAEVELLQGNTAFLKDFLDVPIFDLAKTGSIQAQEVAKPEAVTPKAVATPVMEKPIEKPIEKTTETPPSPVAPTPAAPVVAKVVMPKPPITSAPRKNYQGKYVIWTTGQPLPGERVLIKKIIEAVKIPAASLVLETTSQPASSDWSTTPFVFAFGIQNLPGGLHSLQQWEGTRLLKTCSLAELEANLNQKKALWTLLKKAFQL